LKKLRANGRLAVDTNAVIAYRAGVLEVCDLIERADAILLPVTVLGELLYGAINSARSQENEQAVRKFLVQRQNIVCQAKRKSLNIFAIAFAAEEFPPGRE